MISVGYQPDIRGYQPDIRGYQGYQVYQPDIKYISRIQGYQPNIRGYQPDIKATCTPDIRSYYPLAEGISTQWPDELTACDAVLAKEIDLRRRLWIERKAEDRPCSFRDALHHCEQNTFPQVFNFLQIGATLPVSVATVERSFSTLKRLKSYLHNSCGEDRLNGLALMTIHREKVPPVEEVLKIFSQKPRRFDL